MDGNTPLSFTSNYAAQGSPFPENEDINGDNTLSDLENYYEFCRFRHFLYLFKSK